MIPPLWPALITCLALIIYAWTIVVCGSARGKYGVKAPAVTGHPEFEKRFRIQQNTLEQLVIFLPSLWIFSATVSPVWGGALGLVFVVARLVYVVSYAGDPEKRGPGFGLGAIATLILLAGGLIGVIRLMAMGPA